MRPDMEEEFRAFVATQREHLRGYAFLLCTDWDRADDLVQQTLMKLYAVWPRISERGVHSYVRRALTNTFLSENRRLWRHRERLTDYDAVDFGGAPPDHETRLSVLAALRQLPPRQRAAMVLRFWEDLSVSETAEVMRCAPGTVKSHVAKATQTLRALLPGLDPVHFGQPV